MSAAAGNMRRLVIFLLMLTVLGCVSAEKAKEIDRNDHSQPQADLKSEIHSMSSPASGLRAATLGSSSCSACAH